MKFKGTEGKWEITDKGDCLAIETFGVTNWLICETVSKTEEDKANALLIAHAPELLRALKESNDIIKAFNFRHTQIDLNETLITKSTTL